MSENQCQKICVNRSTPSSAVVTTEQCTTASVSQQVEQQQQSSSGEGIAAPAFEIEEKLNELYEKRLAEINEQANGDALLKEITYKEWITMLRQINTTLITNIQEIDCETTKRLALLQRKSSSNCRHDQAIEMCKYRNDIQNLIHLIRNARHNDDWSTDGLKFETISEHDIFGEPLCCQPMIKRESDVNKQSSSIEAKACAVQKSKLMTHLKALAFEIAERHDEMRDLKRQIISLEDDILNAQKKIQLKDDVIRELRNDLKTFPKSAATWGRRVSERLSPIDCFPLLMMSEAKISETSELDFPHTPRADSYKNRDSINSLNFSEFSLPFQDEDDEEILIKKLKDELTQLFEIQESYDQSLGNQKRELKDLQPRINKMVDELVKTNHDQQIKLRFYRRELLNLENPESCSRTIADEDSGISSDVDSDAKIVNAVRNRVCCLVDDNRRLQKQEQSLQIENEGLISQVKAKSILLDKTSKALREVADTISIAICKPIHYEEIFEQNSNMLTNPIVDAFGELLDTLTERDKLIGDLRAKIDSTVKSNRELQANSDHLQDQLCELKNSIKTIHDHDQYKSRGKLFQNQEFSRNLFEKNEELKNLVCCLERKICFLQNKFDELQQKPCERCHDSVRLENRQQSRGQSLNRTSSDEKLQKLESELRWKCKAVENLKSENEELQRELTDIRRNRAKTKLQQRRDPTPDRKPNQQELLSKLNAAQEKNIEQSKALQKASKQISCLQHEIEELHSNEEVHKKERDLLHSELTALKECQASQIGTQQSLKEQLQRTTSELYGAREKLSECNLEKNRLENIHRDETKRLQENLYEAVEKYNHLVEDFNKVVHEYQKLVEINEEKDKIISACDAWKKSQIQIDTEMQKKTQLFEKHIKEMLEDKQMLLDRLNETENDNLILKQTLENSRFYLSGNQSSIASGSLRGYKTSVANSTQVDPVRFQK
ncbi:major antigen isoform X2 [Episyrphus balteatus]|uniref:major antigen isoform X2 n=1 Tax=Episyrphus balteatus TaxID=286459 RepID=UPI00248604B0|nr:major antigen isoform X2 [Episyrphus balteatus]